MMKALNWAKHYAQSQLISFAERRFSCESFSVAKRIGVNCGSELISVSLSVIRNEKPINEHNKGQKEHSKSSLFTLYFYAVVSQHYLPFICIENYLY